MDKVLAICDKYAILRKDKPARSNAGKELRALTDIKIDSDDYLKKQVEPYLRLYGRRLARDVRFHPLGLSKRGLPDKHLNRIGYYEFENDCTGDFFLNRLDREDNNTYVVPIRGMDAGGDGVESGGYSLQHLQEAIIYAAKLALLSQDGKNCGLPITIEKDEHQSVIYFEDVPLQFYYCPEWMPLENVFNVSRDAIVDIHGDIRRESHAFKMTLDHFDFSFVQQDSDITRYAASLFLVCVEHTYLFGCGQFAVDANNGSIIKQPSNNLISAVIENVASGSVHTCPYCKRPVFGTSKFCRYGGCYQRVSEKAQAQIEMGLSLKDAIELYGDYFKESTIKNWVQKGR